MDIKHVPQVDEGSEKPKLRRNASVISNTVVKTVPVENAHGHGSEDAVMKAVIGNGSVAILKFIAYFVTGSGAMLSESVHSVADTMNQCLLVIGIRRARLKADSEFQYGHHRETYIWSLISAVGIFFLGAGATISHGISSLYHPHAVHHETLALSVLFVSFVVEGYTLLVAILEVRRAAKAGNTSFISYVREGSDPTAVAVVLEDSVAVMGVMIAAAAIFITKWTGSSVFDSIGSIMIGLLLGAVAIFLIRKNTLLLTGHAPNAKELSKFSSVLEQHDGVGKVTDLRGEMMGMDAIRLKADIDFNGRYVGKKVLEKEDIDTVYDECSKSREACEEYLIGFAERVVDSVADVVDEIEVDIQEKIPGEVFIDLEAD